MKKMNITIVGGSNSAHTLIPLLSHFGHSVNLLTRNPEKWSDEIIMKYILPDGTEKSRIKGKLNIVTSKPEEVIPLADIVILSLPVSSYRDVLHKIAPYLRNDPGVFVGTIYGQGGFNWMVDEIKEKFELSEINYFAVGLIPWITRTELYGNVGITYGPKAVNVVAISDKNQFVLLNSIFLNDICFNYFGKGEFVLSEDFLSLSLSVDNQIIHLARLYGMYLQSGGLWEKYEDVPLFYKDFDDVSADIMQKLDADYTKIREAIKARFPENSFKYMLDYLELERFSYNSVNNDIKNSFTSSETLGQIPTPVIQDESGGWIYNKHHRFFVDDLYYGLVIAKWIAEEFSIETNTIDQIIYWAQDVVEENLLANGKLNRESFNNGTSFKYGIPSQYGFNKIKDIIG